MNAGDSLNKITVTWPAPTSRRGGKCGQLGGDTGYYLRLQLRKLAVKHLRHRMLNDLLNLLAIRHSHGTIPATSLF